MSFPVIVPQAKIDRLRKEKERREERWAEIGHDPERNGSLQAALKRKECWLEIYSQCLSPSLACKQTGIAMSTYRKWRSEDVDFCEQLNAHVRDWREELLSSAVTRAIGRTHKDEEGKLKRDASGKIIYTDGSDSLARQLLGMDAEEGKSENQSVNITFNLSAYGLERGEAETIAEVNTRTLGAVDAEFTEVEPDPAA
jgi:hypothetical protein